MFQYVASSATNGIFNVSITTATTSSTYAPVQVLPLREPRLEALPGWLSPNGDYYPVNYPRGQRHGEIAEAILTALLPGLLGTGAEQTLLMNQGWVRVDHDSVAPSNAKTTRKQRETLRKLVQLSGDDSWESAKRLINSFTFNQAKRGKRKAA